MSLINYNYYIKQVIELSRSIVIKSSIAATEFNKWVELNNHVVTEDPTTWKYYMNLAGIKHVMDDTVLVSSFDTKETIEFTVENLNLHPATKLNYQPHTDNYKNLIKKYPNSELLIKGVLNPVDINLAIESPDYTILTYNSTLVETQETNLISSLQTRVYNYGIRWSNSAYHLVDDLYLAGHLGILYLNIPNWILSVRLENLKSRFAHSYHIKEYLRSNGYLDRYYEYMTIKQALFLYRNIQYIEQNGGKQYIFEWLYKNLLTDRGLGLAEYNLNIDLEEITDNGVGSVEFNRNPLNAFHLSTKSETFSLEELLIKERPVARSNIRVELDTVKENEVQLNNPKSNRYKTKVLESSTLDFSDSGVTIFTQELLKYWLVWSTTGRYESTFRFINPKTNKQITLDAKDSFILFLYVYNLSNGITLTKLPKLRVNLVRTDNLMDFSPLESMSTNEFYKGRVKEFLTTNRLLNTPIPFNYTFAYRVLDVNNEFKALRELYSLNEDYRGRSQLQSCADRLYHTTDIELLTTSYQEWLDSRGIDIDGIDPVEYTSFYKSIVRNVTGIDYVSTITVRGIQKAMVEIMEQLSSYNVQYLREVNENPILVWDKLAVRPGPTLLKSLHDLRLDTLTKIVTDVGGRSKVLLDLPVFNTLKTIESTPYKTIVNIDIGLDYSLDTKPKSTIRYEIPNVSLSLL